MLRKLRRKGRAPRVDVATLNAAWRPHLTRALAARDGLDRLAASAPPGPARDRLAAVVPDLDAGIAALAEAARRAAALAAALPADLAERQLAELKRARRALAAAQETGQPSAALEAEVALLAGRHAAVQRARNELEDLPERARLLALRIEAAVAQAAAVALAGGPDLSAVETEIEDAIEGLATLRAGLDELEGLSRPIPGDAERP